MVLQDALVNLAMKSPLSFLKKISTCNDIVAVLPIGQIAFRIAIAYLQLRNEFVI